MNLNTVFIHDAERIIQSAHTGRFFVLYADIDDFQSINSFFGADAGDALLKSVEHFLSGDPTVRLCMRLFADHFVCLLQTLDGQSIEDLMKARDVQLADFLEAQQVQFLTSRLKIACGVCPVKNGHVARAIDGANTARKASKKQLSVVSVLYNQDMEAHEIAWHETELEVYSALKAQRFDFYLQPKVDLTTGAIVGAEALARRLGENGEIIYPDAFLSVMEKNGMVVELDRLICRQVCAFLARRIAAHLPVTRVSVNLSRLHIQNADTAEQLHAIATSYHILPELLEFELTETILLEEFTGAKVLIDQLRAYGYRVSIDDFGSGYAGINIWQELSFDCLKLDRKFLSDDDSALKKRNAAIVPNIIDIAQRLHVEVLCEGVETEDQCRYLLQLGCTMVQGFYFAKPMPAEQFFKIYEAQKGKYELADSLAPAPEQASPFTQEESGLPGKRRRALTRARAYLIVVLLCALFVGLCITTVLSYNRHLTHDKFVRMITETLSAYTTGQRENTLTQIDGVVNTLQTLAVFIAQKDDPKFLNAYLTALNEGTPEISYYFPSYADYLRAVDEGMVRSQDQEIVGRLLEGQTVVSDIVYSARMGNIYCISVGVPIFRNGAFAGVVRGIIDAQMLVSTELYDPAQGRLAAAFLTDDRGEILPVRAAEQGKLGNLLTLLKDGDVDPAVLNQVRSGLAFAASDVRTFRLGEFGGAPYYLSLTGLRYNGWHLVVILQADAAVMQYQSIVHSSHHSILTLLAVVLVAFSVLFGLIRTLQRRSSADEQRYLLLEHFSDTVLFNYDPRRDTIHFTSNAARLFRIHNLRQRGFLHHLNLGYIYAGDIEIVRSILDGQGPAEEIRIRVLRPDRQEFFWCLVQSQYLYEKGKLIAIIGKITDIDEHMRHEDYLLRMSETDGLTGLQNKTSSEKRIAAELHHVQKGLLFLIDLDAFKTINDQYGHAAGDLALHAVGDALQRVFRRNDVLGRIGGDELVAFIGGTDDRVIARRKAELMQKHLESGAEPGTPPFTVSIGIARYPADGASFEALFQAADKAMYNAKKAGKARCCFYENIVKKNAD